MSEQLVTPPFRSQLTTINVFSVPGIWVKIFVALPHPMFWGRPRDLVICVYREEPAKLTVEMITVVFWDLKLRRRCCAELEKWWPVMRL